MRRFAYYSITDGKYTDIYSALRPNDAARMCAVRLFRAIKLSGGDIGKPIYISLRETTESQNRHYFYRAERVQRKCKNYYLSKTSYKPYKYQSMVKITSLTDEKFRELNSGKIE